MNGKRVTEAILHDGDEITAGDTAFVVHIVETAQTALAAGTPVPVVFQAGGWSFSAVPSGWETIEQQGIRRAAKDVFPSNAVVNEELLPNEKTLREYVDSQLLLLRHFVPELEAEAPAPAAVPGAAEAIGLLIRYSSDDGRPVAQRQVYARVGQLVGILTFTTLENELPAVQSVFELILAGSAFRPKDPSETQPEQK